MAEIGFYHLTRTGADAALPTLLGRTLAAGQRALVLCGSPARAAAIDDALWLCESPDWLPHGGPADGDAPLQPIWIASADAAVGDAPNAARFLFLLDGASARLDSFARVFTLFDGNDAEALAGARLAWQAAKQAGHTLTYWRQTASGWTQG